MKRIYYSVSEVADMLGVSTQTVRKYELMGILQPTRTGNKYRRFESPDITMLMRIRMLRNMGFSLDEIQKIMIHPWSNDVDVLYSQRIENMEQEIQRLKVLKECAKLHQEYYNKHRAGDTQIRMEQTQEINGVIYRHNRSIDPAFLDNGTLAKLLEFSPPFQYMICFPKEREKIRQGTYQVGMAIPTELASTAPTFTPNFHFPSRICATVLIRHHVCKKNEEWENLSLDEEFENSGIYRFLEENHLTLKDDIFGLTYFDEIDSAHLSHSIKYYFPVF